MYDEIAALYHLVYRDWNAAIAQPPAAFDAIIRTHVGPPPRSILNGSGFGQCRCTGQYWFRAVGRGKIRIRDAIREAAGSALAGLYLFGSLVVGDFDVDVSDIDLIAVLTSDPSDDLVARLGRMHDALASENPVWAGRIEVIYVSAAALSRWWEGIARMAVISPGEPFHVVDGGPDRVLNWYPARESAVALLGPPVETFPPPISREAFESAVRQHLRQFPSRVRDGDSLPAQAYAILTMCRGWYTLCVGDQPSKVEAAAWAQRKFPEWAPLIRSALAWRKGGVSAGDSGAGEVQRFVAEIARRVDA